MRTQTIVLGLSNLLLLAVLLITFNHYNVFGKLNRRIFIEKRIPFVSEPFRINRNYSYYREIFKLYPKQKRDGLVVGDSQVSSVSWSELIKEVDVGSMGIPGDTTAGLLFRTDDFYRHDPDWIGVLIGTNDVLQNVPLDVVLANIEACAAKLRGDNPNIHLFIVSTPSFSKWVEASKQRNTQVVAVNRAFANYAESQESVSWVDLHSLITDKSGYLMPSMTSDGVHLSAQAYALLKTELVRLVSSLPRKDEDF